MGGIGHKPPPYLLGGLKPTGKGVKFLGHLAHLIPAGNLHPVAVFSLPHNADGPQKLGDPPRQGLGEKEGKGHGHKDNNKRDGPQGLLNAQKEAALLGVVLIHIDRTQGHAPVGHRHRRPAAERPGRKVHPEHIVPFQSGHHLPQHGISSHGPRGRGRVIHHHPGGIGHQHPAQSGIAQHLHHPAHTLLAQCVRPRQSGGHHGGLTLERGLL